MSSFFFASVPVFVDVPPGTREEFSRPDAMSRREGGRLFGVSVGRDGRGVPNDARSPDAGVVAPVDRRARLAEDGRLPPGLDQRLTLSWNEVIFPRLSDDCALDAPCSSPPSAPPAGAGVDIRPKCKVALNNTVEAQRALALRNLGAFLLFTPRGHRLGDAAAP